MQQSAPKSPMRNANLGTPAVTPGGRRGGNSEAKVAHFDQRALLKEMDRAMRRRPQPPSQRFISPLGGPGRSFD